MPEFKTPKYDFCINNNPTPKIFDFIRKKYVALTPEEWVRQNFLKFLVQEKKYPPTLIYLEKSLRMGKMSKRCDAVVYDNKANPLMILEFKAPQIALTQNVFDQIARYNATLQVKYLIITNGLKYFCCKIDAKNNSYEFMDDIPEYNLLKS